MNDSHQIYITIKLQQTKGKMSSYLPFCQNGKSLSCSSHLNLTVLWPQRTNIYMAVTINNFFCLLLTFSHT